MAMVIFFVLAIIAVVAWICLALFVLLLPATPKLNISLLRAGIEWGLRSLNNTELLRFSVRV